MALTTWHIFAVILPRFHIAYKLTPWMQIHSKNCMCKWKPSVYMWGNSSHVFVWQNPWYICGENIFAPKNCLHIQFTQLLSLQVYNNNALWDKQDTMYKDSNYKEAKWKEIMEMLYINKEDVIKRWESLRDTYVRHKNIKSKSGDGLSQCKAKWKYYDIMSFINITLLKWRYVPIYLTTSYIWHTYL